MQPQRRAYIYLINIYKEFLSYRSNINHLLLLALIKSNNSNQMKSNKRVKQEGDHFDTCQTIPRALPSQVIQTTIKKNYEQITSIPDVANAHHIKHLYLSNNQIASLKGIERYTSLVSLNVSYNCLTKISELKLIPYPQKINKISLRMNSFEFGYEDEAIRILKNVNKLEGQALSMRQSQQEILKMKNFISNELIEFYKKTKFIIDQLVCHSNKENIDINQRKPGKVRLSTQFMDNIFFSKVKDIYVYPTQQVLRSKSISYLLNICYEYTNIFHKTQIQVCTKHQKKQDNYLQETRQTFQQICNQILLKYSARHDNTLRDDLKKIQRQGQLLVNAFSRLGQFECEGKSNLGGEGVKAGFIGANTSKYMKRIKNQELIHHPMSLLANWKMPQYCTLIPLQQTKWHHFYQQKNTDDSGQPLYQKIPIFVYCKEYLEVVAEIILDQITKILNLQSHIIQVNKHLPSSSASEEEVELNLSKSSIMSFGAKQQEDSLDQQTQLHQHKMEVDKTINYKSMPKKNHTVYEQEDRIQFNLNKYSIYQINLVYKAFRSLKIKVKQSQQGFGNLQ